MLRRRGARRGADASRRSARPPPARAAGAEGGPGAGDGAAEVPEGPATDWSTLSARLVAVGLPYWTESDERVGARWRLAGVLGLTLATTGCSVAFNFIGRDFFSSISDKDPEAFQRNLAMYVGAIAVAIPIFVMRDFFANRLVLRWRNWMTRDYVGRYFERRTFYKIQSGGLVDNPDQRINDDVAAFCDTSLSLSLSLFNSVIDLVSFSGIMLSIYPPLFGVLLVYAVGGTFLSVRIGEGLIGLNFEQEQREADFRYSLVRVRENAESIAFYGGEENERAILLARLKASLDNFGRVLVGQRNLDFFTSSYRFLIQFLPAAVVAPLYFKGEIEFGVITQSNSAFNHILNDVSLIVYQFGTIASFSAVIDRLGQFTDVLEDVASPGGEGAHLLPRGGISRETLGVNGASGGALLQVEGLTLRTPQTEALLIDGLTCSVREGVPLLVMGASGAGKTSLLRAVAGLWDSGEGTVRIRSGDVFFVPQRPYLVLGSLRQQLLYPTWTECRTDGDEDGGDAPEVDCRPPPSNAELEEVLRTVRLGGLIGRCDGLDAEADWTTTLSLGEQQRLAFARLLLAKPQLALLDESTSALDIDSEALMYRLLRDSGVTYCSIGHRPSLRDYHDEMLTLGGSAEGGGQAERWAVTALPAKSR